MNKRIIVLSILLTISLAAIVFLAVKLEYNESNISILKKYNALDGAVPEMGFVPDKEAASKIAEAVFLPIYGSEIYTEKPFIVKYDNTYKVWIVIGDLEPVKFRWEAGHKVRVVPSRVGGSPHVIIRKIDGKILAVWHDL